MAYDGPAYKYFFDRVKKNPDTGCIEWIGTITNHGYGVFLLKKFHNRPLGAHRVSYFLFVGDIGENQVLHNCDNPKCVNPKHLFLGKPKDNSEDMVKKDRHNYGEARPQHKLTDENVLEIRRTRKFGISWQDFADKFGTSHTCIKNACEGKTWKHLDNIEPPHKGG